MNPRKTRHAPVSVDFIGSFPKRLPAPTLPEVAIAGRSNVGKSSAINTLLVRKAAARVSKTPGRTQAINLFNIDQRFILADLPGYGFAKVPEDVQARWKDLVEGYLGTRETLRLVICLVDARHGPQKNDLALLSGLRAAELRYRVVATKVDKLKRNKRQGALSKLARGLGEERLIAFSSETREGTDAVWALIDRAIEKASR
jgi:GTP-binding protein